MYIAPQAIDQASNRVLGIYHETKLKQVHLGEDEGFYSWLIRVANEALAKGEMLPSGKVRHGMIKFYIIPSARSGVGNLDHHLLSVERVR